MAAPEKLHGNSPKTEPVGFEPTEPFGSLVFETSAFVRSAKAPNGDSRIRTYETRFTRLLVFQTSAIVHSAISPNTLISYKYNINNLILFYSSHFQYSR